VVARLAAEPAEQLAYLEALNTTPSVDELALTLDDELGRVRSSLAADHPLLFLERRLREMSGGENAPMWHADALHTEPWEEVRRLAQAALVELDARPV
jgi:hypothetical protein